MEYILAHPLSVLNSFICAALFYHCVCLLNSRKWPWKSGYAWGYKFLAVGSFASTVGPLYGYVYPDVSEIIGNLGVLVIAMAVVYRQPFRKPKNETST